MFLPGLRGVGYGWIPLVAGGSLLVGFAVPYYIAVQLGHVYPILPFISDTGALHPENCVFGQMLNVTSALLVVIVYIRYRQIEQCKDGPTDLAELNQLSACFGYLAAAGLSLVANVQINVNNEHSIETVTHLVCSVVGFSGAIFYGFTQSWLTYKTTTDCWSWTMALLRFVLSCLATTFAFTVLEFRDLSRAEFNGTYAETLQWNPYDGGYVYHVYSSVSEYLLGLTLLVLIVTFYKELKTITPLVEETNQVKGVRGYTMIARDPLA